MDERKRLTVAASTSILLHIVGLLVLSFHRVDARVGLAGGDEPIIVRLQPMQTDPIKRLVNSAVPAKEPVDISTDLISDRNSKASDFSNVEGTRKAPQMDEASQFDELRSPGPVPMATGTTPSAPAAEISPPKPKLQEETTSAEPTLTAAPPPEPRSPPEAKLEESERMQLAQAVTPAVPLPETGPSRGRVEGGVKNLGFLGFEAMKHELAPYLQEVRRRVEKRWIAALHMKYSGASQTQAVLDCAINADGKLVYVAIVDPGPAVGYAPLCKEAIESAGPFPPFPFRVPEVYRSKNLEIRWTFSFL
ncbi:MAG: TonB C-terminal domain-containing protein [Candidatus Hydrogenedentes bacterium]|nr:TonB C-terminal domain-containing protein [Candidatus Hydrogenedentota bacterium]